MHSSRMRTAHISGRLGRGGEGVVCLGGVCLGVYVRLDDVCPGDLPRGVYTPCEQND